MPPDWTVYDAKKLQLGLKIVSHAAVLLRLVCSPQVVRRHSDLQAVNANAAAEAFCRCAALSQQLSALSSMPASRAIDGTAGDRMLERAAGLVGLPFGAAAGTPGRSTAAASVDWLRSPLAVSAPFSRFAAENNPLSPTPRSTAAAAASVSAVGGFNVDATSARGESGTVEEEAGRLAVAETLLVVAENLVCVVHSLAQLQAHHPATSASSNGGSSVIREGAAGASVLSAEATQKTLEAANAFPPHSFIRQVARWIQDLAHH
jgi:hypothetical protein